MAKELQVLTALDAARTQLYHFTAILIAGMGFFTDGYDLFCISTVTRLLGRIYYYDASTGKPGALPAHVQAAVNGVALCGTLAGHLFFGCLGDSMGRKKAYGFTLQLMVAFSLASGLSFGSSRKAVMTTLCFVRFWLGFGVGGDYPLSATIMSEFANKRTRGAFIAAVFAMQGLGILAGATVSIVVAAAFMNGKNIPSFDAEAETSTPRSADYVWRIVLMFGAIPAGLTYYWRMKMPETPRYTALVARDAKQAALDMSKVLPVELTGDAEYDGEQQYREKAPQYGLFSYEFLRRHGLHLLGTTSTWFLLDIAFYSQNLLQKDLFTAVGWIPDAKEMNAVEEVFRVARAQALVALFSTVPGYWFTVLFIERLGRFGIQFMGFVFMTVFMLAVSIPYDHWRGHACENDSSKLCGGHPLAFVVLYAFTFFFSNFGPNSTTFIVPAELFPARLRSTCHGISAAAGKAGAIVGMFGFLYASQSPDIGIRWALIILGITNGLGALFTLLVPETKGKSLEELSGENMETKGKSPEELSGEDLETKGKSLEELFR